MDIIEAQQVLSAVGSDTAPTSAQLTEARTALVGAARTAKDAGDRQSLATMLEAIKLADRAISEVAALEATAAAELDALTADIPELATEVVEPVAPDESGAAPRVLSIAEAAARLGLGASAPAEVTERPTQTLTIEGRESSGATWADLGNAFAKSASSALRGGRTTLATLRTEYTHNLTGKQGPDSRILDDLTRQAHDPAVVAAGGCCSLAEPIRDQPMLASLSRPLADALPVVGASAGAVTLYPPICLPQGGVATWSCAQDAAVESDDEETWKDCYEVDCAAASTVTVEAIYRCLTIGNFQQRFSPERWDAILHAATAQTARVAEIALFNKIATSPLTTVHTVTNTGSVYLTFLQNVLLAAATIRQNQRYSDIGLHVFAPEWLKAAIQADRIARAIQRGRASEGGDVTEILAENNISVTWSPDLNPIEPTGQVSGPLTAYPANASIVLFADGGVFRLDGGELNLGTEIRDYDLNRQNKLSAFAESFETALVRSCDTKAITIPVTVCGSAPCSSTPPGATAGAPLFTSEVP